MSSSAYTFSFNADLTEVTALFKADKRKLKAENIAGDQFDVETGTTATGQPQVSQVTCTHETRGDVETTVYADHDGDGRFHETFELEVSTAATPRYALEQHQFDIDAAGNVTADREWSKGRWKNERIDANEQYDVIDLAGVRYVMKTETEYDKVEFSLYRDDNGDGRWTQVAEGESSGPYLDASTQTVDLIGLQPLLMAADGLVG